MRAIAIAKPGGPDVLTLVDRPAPEPSRGEVRVRVRATAVNRADLLQRMGMYPPPKDAPQDIPGLELAGEVDRVGDGVERLKVGDRVFGLVGGGAYAEYIVSHERALALIPAGLSFEQAAAVPEAFVTAHDAMVAQGKLTAGECVLISAAGSGVGTAGIQLARAIGATSIGTARTADKLARAKALGLDHGVVPDGGRFADAVRKLREPEVVLELVGGSYVDEDLRCLATRGRIVVVGLTGGRTVQLDLGLQMSKRAAIIGTVLRARPLEEKIAAMRAFEAQVVPLFAAGKLEAVIDQVFDLDRAADAHARMASNEGYGKVVLRV